jgi:flagellar biosynthesis protein FliQ
MQDLSSMEAARNASPASESKKLRWLVMGMSVVLVLNLVLVGVLVVELRGAKAQATELQTKFLPVVNTVTTILKLGHFLQGNVPDLVNGVIQTNFNQFGNDVYKASSKVQNAFDSNNNWPMIQVAAYAALIKSIAQKVSTVNPVFQSPAPYSSDEGIMGTLTYAVQFIDSQLNMTSIGALAQSCTSMTDAMLNTDFSGFYTWGQGSYSGSWDANGMKPTVAQVQQYCLRAATVANMQTGKGEDEAPHS